MAPRSQLRLHWHVFGAAVPPSPASVGAAASAGWSRPGLALLRDLDPPYTASPPGGRGRREGPPPTADLQRSCTWCGTFGPVPTLLGVAPGSGHVPGWHWEGGAPTSSLWAAPRETLDLSQDSPRFCCLSESPRAPGPGSRAGRPLQWPLGPRVPGYTLPRCRLIASLSTRFFISVWSTSAAPARL